MWKTTMKLPDGRCLSSGEPGVSAIKSFALTRCVNDNRELTLGSVCAAMAELSIYDRDGLQICPGDVLEIYREDMQGNREDVGVFLAEKPQRPTTGVLKVTAYDRVTLLDRDLSSWLAGLTGWPYSLQTFGEMVCQACGLTLVSQSIPNADHVVRQFSGSGITGRQIMRWIGELAGRFCRCNAQGALEFGWYRSTDCRLKPQNYYQAGFSREDYTVCPIEKIQIRQGQEDVGTVYPPEPAGDHTYVISANPLASADTSESLIGVAQTLFEQLQSVSYTPCVVKVPGGSGINCGDVIAVEDGQGNGFTVYVMKQKLQNGMETLECTGSQRRDSTTAVNQLSYKALNGKVLNVQAAVEGLRIENRDTQGRLASLQMDVDGIASEVSRQQTQLGNVSTQMTQIAQNAESVDIRIQQITQEGVDKVKTETGFTLDARGLTISREGTRMENLLDETGMFVRRMGQVLLKADQEGVTAVDVSVENYLIVGDHARFEDYRSGTDTQRTACFWI